MKIKLTRLISILALAMLGLMLSSPVFAIDSPDSLQINAVYVYRHCLETNDQLYIVKYYADYDPDADPLTDDNPAENITEAYLGRLMDGVDELGSTAPYAYYDDGYDEGIFAIYFSASNPDLPTWANAYTMKLEGNPTLTWTAVPSIQVGVFDLWSSSTSINETQAELAARILYLADQLEMAWGINMVDSTGTGSYLSDYGEAYFTNAIPNIQSMAPDAFVGSSAQPNFAIRTPGTDYADDRADSVNGTMLDTQELADWWGVSRMWASSLLYILAGIFLLYAILSPTGSYKGLVLLSIPLVIGGGYLGMIPLLLTVLLGVAAFFISLFLLFYHPSGI